MAGQQNMRHDRACNGCEPVCAARLRNAERDAKGAAQSYRDLERRVRWIGEVPYIEAFGSVSELEMDIAASALPKSHGLTRDDLRRVLTLVLQRGGVADAAPLGEKDAA